MRCESGAVIDPHLLLKRAGHQPAQLRQTVIDPVPAALLNDLFKQIVKSLRTVKSFIQHYRWSFQGFATMKNALTPLRRFLACTWELVDGDIEPSGEFTPL